MFIDRVVSSDGTTLETGAVKTRQALDPRVAYQVTSILEDVIDHGTGASVRARGFQGPAAGKTGTSRDGWFAGYTSNLLCIVWVGFDDNRDLDSFRRGFRGADLGRVHEARDGAAGYHDLQDFEAPEGLTEVEIDPTTQALATPACPDVIGKKFSSRAPSRPSSAITHGGSSLSQGSSDVVALAPVWRRQAEGRE